MTKKKKTRNNNKKNRGAQKQAERTEAVADDRASLPKRATTEGPELVDERTALLTMLTTNPLKSSEELPTGEPPIACRDLTLEELKRRIQISNHSYIRTMYDGAREEAALLLNPKDDKDRYMDFIEAGKNLDAKRLVKCMPHTARDLKANKIDLNEFTRTTKNLLGIRFKRFCISVDRPLKKVVECALSFVPGLPYYDTCHLLIRSKTKALMALEVSDRLSTLAKCIKHATDLACMFLAADLDREFFQGKEGAFLRTCPAFCQPASHFESFLLNFEASNGFQIATFAEEEEVVKEAELMLDKLIIGLYGIANLNIEEVKKCCWECGKTPVKLMACTGCHVANYCGRECQVKAWQSGHKQQCKHLPTHFKNFEESWQTFVRAHANPEEGIVLNDTIDYFVFDRMQDSPPCIDFSGGYQVASGPSMEIFYENIRRIQSGDLWVWKNPDSMEDYELKFLSAAEQEEIDVGAFMIISDLLCYRFEQKTRSVPISTSSDQVAYWKITPSLFAPHGLSELAMPVERYLQIYLGGFPESADALNALSNQTPWHRKYNALRSFRGWAHKGGKLTFQQRFERNAKRRPCADRWSGKHGAAEE